MRLALRTWFERDRAWVALVDEDAGDATVVEWWDDAVQEAVDDGFLDPRDYRGSAERCARDLGLLPPAPVAPIGLAGPIEK